ncbi:MAG: hypothetical protein BME94_07935 [Methanobacteriales archaeon Met13]
MIEMMFPVFIDVIIAIIPVLGLILFFQIVILKKTPSDIKKMLLGVLMTIFGFFFFLFGAKMSLIPVGDMIGEFLSKCNIFEVVLFTFVFGIICVFAEPAVNILAYEIEEVSSGYIHKNLVVFPIAIGVGFALVFGTLRIFHELSLAYILIPGYILILLLTCVAPKEFVPIAYDTGAVAVGPVAITFALPMMIGMANGLWGDGSGILGLGTVGLIAMCPIIFMLFLGIIFNRRKKSE